MLRLTKEELTEIDKIKALQKRTLFSRLAIIALLFLTLIAVITNIISSSGIFIGLIVSMLMYECSMLRYDHTADILRIIQRNLMLDE